MPTPNSIVDRAKYRNGIPQFVFPKDASPIGMVFTFVRYDYATATRQGFDLEIPSEQVRASISLPIPQSIEDNLGLNIGSAQLGALGGIAGDLTSGQSANFKAAFDNAMQSANELGKEIGAGDYSSLRALATNTQAAARYFGRAGLDSIAPGIGQALEITSGQTINPHTTLNFDGVNLKEFNFVWQLSPKNEAESDLIRNIRDEIRYHILPEFQGFTSGDSSLSRAFLSYPDIVLVDFIGLDVDHYFKFKPAMVKNLAMNYSSQGNTIMKGGKPGFVTMTMSVQEIRPQNRKDYEG